MLDRINPIKSRQQPSEQKNTGGHLPRTTIDEINSSRQRHEKDMHQNNAISTESKEVMILHQHHTIYTSESTFEVNEKNEIKFRTAIDEINSSRRHEK